MQQNETMKDCKEFYLNKDNKWTIIYQDGSSSIVEDLPIEFEYIGNTITDDVLYGVTYRYYPIESCEWSFIKDGSLCPILKNEKWGFINAKFQIVVKPLYDYVGEDIEGETCACWRPPLSIHQTQWLNGKCKAVLNGKEVVIMERDCMVSDMSIEQNTNYAYKLKYMANPTFDKVRDLSTRFYRELPQALQDELFEALNRGIDILDSEPQMTAYMFAFGKMHQAKLEYAFNKLPEEFLEQEEICIIDYGCGQALGTMCYADFLRENGYAQNVKTITLIEPSEICLKRAALHASAFFPEADIKTVNKKFDDLTDNDILCSKEFFTLHILSNVLDMTDFDLDKFAKLVKSCLKGHNQFICVGPTFNDLQRAKRIVKFTKSIGGNHVVQESLDSYELNPDKSWTCTLSVFSFDSIPLEEKKSTAVTTEDLAKAVEDRFGVPWCQYSYDRKKMLSYGNTYGDEYIIDADTKIICDECFFDVYNEIDYYYLRRLHIPKSVEYIGKNSFCGSIESIVCDSPHFIVEDYFLLTSDRRKLVFYFGKDKENVNIPEGITIIGSGAFCSTELLSVTIPPSIIEIGDNPFVDAKHWKNDEFEHCVIISNSDRYRVCNSMLFDDVEKRLISYFGNDREIEVPNGTKVIGKNAFFGAEFVKVLLPDSIEYVDETAFYGCLNIFNNTNGIVVPTNSICKFKEILPQYLWSTLVAQYLWSTLVEPLYAEATEDDITNCVEDDFGVVYSRDGKRLLKCNNFELAEYTIRDNTLFVCNNAFNGCWVENLGGYDAPVYSPKLKKIKIPYGVKMIGDGAFSYQGITEINIPSSVMYIGDAAFYNCNSLQQIIIPKESVEKFKQLLPTELWDKLYYLEKADVNAEDQYDDLPF